MTQKLYFNGINGATGSYGISPVSVPELVEHILEKLFGFAENPIRDHCGFVRHAKLAEDCLRKCAHQIRTH